MNHWGMRICVLAVALAAMVQVWGQRPAADNRQAPNEYAAMATALKMTADQQTALNAKVQAMKDALATWDGKNKEMVNNLQKEIREAPDKATAQKLQEQLKPLQDERKGIETNGKKEIMSVLTPEQKVTWDGIMMYQNGEYPAMVKTLPLSTEQEQQLKEKVSAYAAAMDKWEQTSGEKARTLTQQIQDAQAALAPLLAEQTKIKADNLTAIHAVLTPEQQANWAVIKLQQEITGRFGRLKLTEEQTGKIKPLCVAAMAEINQLPANDQRGRDAVKAKLQQTINDTVLTDAQRDELKNKPAR